MSDNTDWTLIVMASQKAQAAAEAAFASARLLESEAGGRLTSIEARMGGVEGRLTTLSAGQRGHALALQRVSDVLAEHGARLTRIEARLSGIEGDLSDIKRSLATILAKLP